MTTAALPPEDRTVYREEDEMGEHEIQTYILELLRPLVERYFRERGIEAHVGSDHLCVLPGVSEGLRAAGGLRIATDHLEFSRTLDCFVRVVGQGSRARLRLATDDQGDAVFPTAEEAERAAKEAALLRVAELEALLAAKERGESATSAARRPHH